MSLDEVCAAVRRGIPNLYTCAPGPESSVRIRTPLMYPDGGLVDLFALDRPSGLLLTDFGETLGWLGLQSASGKRTARQDRLVSDTCRGLAVGLEHGEILLRGVKPDDLADAVQRLALAAVRVSDLWFTLRSRAAESAAEEVSKWLEERRIPFERRVMETGRSGQRWRVDFRTRTVDRRALLFLLSTGASGAARRIAEHVLAGCVDLSHLRRQSGRVALVSLFDDTADVWRAEDFALVEQRSTVARWSRPDELEAILRAA